MSSQSMETSATSDMTGILSSVPQQSILGPLLFLVYVNDLQGVVKKLRINYFTDDTKVSRFIESETDPTYLLDGINTIVPWSFQNRIIANKMASWVLGTFENISRITMTFLHKTIFRISPVQLCPLESSQSSRLKH